MERVFILTGYDDLRGVNTLNKNLEERWKVKMIHSLRRDRQYTGAQTGDAAIIVLEKEADHA